MSSAQAHQQRYKTHWISVEVLPVLVPEIALIHCRQSVYPMRGSKMFHNLHNNTQQVGGHTSLASHKNKAWDATANAFA